MWFLPISILVGTTILAVPLSKYLAWIMNGKYHAPGFLRFFEKKLDSGPQNWKQYTASMLIFNTALFVFGFAVLAMQRENMPLNDLHRGAIAPTTIFHSVVSFMTSRLRMQPLKLRALLKSLVVMLRLLPSLSGPVVTVRTRLPPTNNAAVPRSYLSDAEYHCPVDSVVVDQARLELLCLMPTVPCRFACLRSRINPPKLKKPIKRWRAGGFARALAKPRPAF